MATSCAEQVLRSANTNKRRQQPRRETSLSEKNPDKYRDDAGAMPTSKQQSGESPSFYDISEEHEDVDVDLDIDSLLASAESVKLENLSDLLNDSTRVLRDFTTISMNVDTFGESLIEDDVPHAEEYLTKFERDTEREQISLGIINLEQIQKEEEKLHAEIEKYEKYREEQMTRKQQMLLDRVILVKEQLSKLVASQKKKLREADLRYQRKRRRDAESLNRAFQHAEDKLVSALKHRKADIRTEYGDLIVNEGIYSGSQRRRWRIDWTESPQPVQISLQCIRGLRDKCPSGRLVIAVSMYDRVGGSLMRWSRLSGQEWCGSTLPFKHTAEFFSIETTIDQSVFTVCPPERAVKPSMIFVFELFILKKDNSPFDRGLAWGVFPMLNSDCEIVNGKFKLPLLRGDMDSSITTHRALQQAIASDLDNWLCNLYITVSRLPRYTAGQREYEIELQYTSSILGHPEREINEALSYEDEVAKAVDFIHSRPSTTPQPKPPLGFNSSIKELSSKSVNASLVDQNTQDYDHKIIEQNEDGQRIFLKRGGPFENYRRNVLRLSAERQKQISIPRKKSHIEELEEHTNSVAVLDCPHRRIVGKVDDKTAYVFRELSSEYSLRLIATSTFWITVSCLLVCFWSRLYLHYAGQWVFLQALRIPVTEFVARSFTVNLIYQPSLMLAREQLGVVAMGPVSVFIVMLVLIGIATLSRYLFGRFPDMGYRFILAWCFMTIFDPILILIVDVILHRWRYVTTEPIGDAFKLYWHFEQTDNGGLPGVFVTIFIYIVIMFSSSVITYIYLLRLHLNATILDLYNRLKMPPDETFLPYDHEISIQELEYVVRKAEQWRGQHGERRKVAVYDYIWSPDAEDTTNKRPSLERQKSLGKNSRREMSADDVVLSMCRPVDDEVTTHLAIHTISLDGTSQIFRQFLRLPDGAIVEVFGTISGTVDHRVQKTLESAHVDFSVLTRESTRIIQDKFHSSSFAASNVAPRPSAYSILSTSVLSQMRHRQSSLLKPQISITEDDE
eukprot:gene7714-611_t